MYIYIYIYICRRCGPGPWRAGSAHPAGGALGRRRACRKDITTITTAAAITTGTTGTTSTTITTSTTSTTITTTRLARFHDRLAPLPLGEHNTQPLLGDFNNYDKRGLLRHPSIRRIAKQPDTTQSLSLAESQNYMSTPGMLCAEDADCGAG